MFDQRMKKREKAAHHLPLEVMVDILSRLPVKTLMRFRCVCKQWRNLIHDPFFVTMHTAAHKNDVSYIIQNPGNDGFSFFCWDKPYVDYRGKAAAAESQLLDLPISYRAILHASCHGLICYSVPYRTGLVFFLLNPSLKKLKALAYNPSHTIPFETCDQYVVGLGFASKSKKKVVDYKVVTISDGRDRRSIHMLRVDQAPPPPRVQVYTSSTNSWKSINDPTVVSMNITSKSTSTTLVNGALHWLGRKKKNIEEKADDLILSFELEEEVFQEITLPNYRVYGRTLLPFIGNFRESLSFIAYSPLINYGVHGVHVWVMKEYGVVESWAKLFTVDLKEDIRKPLCFGDNGFLLQHQDFEKTRLFEFVAVQEWKDLQLQLHELYTFHRAVAYTESLVLLNNEDDDNLDDKLFKKVEDHAISHVKYRNKQVIIKRKHI